MALAVNNPRIEFCTHPLGIDIVKPRFSWELTSDLRGSRQAAWQIQVSINGQPLWDSGIQESDQSIEIVYGGPDLKPTTLYNWTVTAWDNHGNQAAASSWWETGMMGKQWEAKWVEPLQVPTMPEKKPEVNTGEGFQSEAASLFGTKKLNRDYAEFNPCQYLRKEFKVNKTIARARIYATAHGIYQLELNGKKVDNREFAPEITAYQKLLQYQTYDITGLLRKNENVIGAILADGWWIGRVGITGDCCQYGNTLGFLMQMELLYDDGTMDIVKSDDMKSSAGPLIFSDIFVGEKYDAAKELHGWSEPSFDDVGWEPVQVKEYGYDTLIGQIGEPVRRIHSFTPVAILTTPKGETVVDLGQVIAGRVRMRVTAPKGTMISLEHSEVLDEEGNFLNNIIGVNKDQTDFYLCKGEGRESYEPIFTYHGFRYVKVTGFPGTPSVHDFIAVVLSSDVADLASFACSDLRINRLMKNIWWSQVANTLSLPTDCPQRERAGWTGDLLVFAPTMVTNRDSDAFLTRWLRNCQAEQMDDGQITMIVPYLPAYREFSKMMGTDTSCGWGDAILAVPWVLYQTYGDVGVLSENYPAMKRWLQYVENKATQEVPEGYENFDEARKARQKYLWNKGFHFGDWLIPSKSIAKDGETVNMIISAFLTKDVVAPAFYAYNTEMISKIATILGKQEDAAYYRDLNGKIRKAFAEEYIHEDGTMDADFQGIYIIALQMGLVPEDRKEKMLDHLCDMIAKNNGCLDTGFLSIPFLMDVLTKNGRKQEAYKLLYQTNCPSWLYEVEHGATTMWEAWQAILPNGKVTDVSYNHYAFGCVGDWIYREVVGLNAAAPGYKKILVKPGLDCGLTYASCSHDSVYGKAAVAWEIKEGKTTLSVAVPANASATVVLPAASVATTTESGNPLLQGDGINSISVTGNGVEVDVGSGIYSFVF